MPEMKTLNGFEIVDAQAREDIEALQNAGYSTEDYVDKAIEAIPEVDLTDYAFRSELPTKTSQLTNDNRFITLAEVPKTDLSAYAKKSEIPDVSSFITSIPSEYITETELNAKGYLTAHQSLAGLATEKYVDDSIAAIPEVDLSDYAKKADIPDVSGFANKTDIPDVSEFISEIPAEYITENELNAKGYLTEHQSLDGYATEAFVTNKIAEAKLEGEGETIDLSGYATKDDISDFITEVPAEYVTETELNSKGYLTQHQSLADYAKKSEIPDVSNFITEVPSEYITESELNAKGYLTQHQSLTGLATEKYVDDAIAAIPDTDLSEYAKKTELPDVSGLATTQSVQETKADVTAIEARVGVLESDSASYLTSIPTEYVTDTELTNKGYITASSVASSYYPKSSGQANAAKIAAIESDYATTSYVDTAVANAPGAVQLYRHNVLIHDGSSWTGVNLSIIDTSSTKYTFDTLWTYIKNNYYVGVCGLEQDTRGSSASAVSAVYTNISATGTTSAKTLTLKGIRMSKGSNSSTFINTELTSTIKVADIVVAID